MTKNEKYAPLQINSAADFYFKHRHIMDGPRWGDISQKQREAWVAVYQFHFDIVRREVDRALKYERDKKAWWKRILRL